MNKKTFALIATASAVLLSIIIVFSGEDDVEIATKELDTENIKELVRNFGSGEINDQGAGISSHELFVVNSDGSQIVYDLPEDLFFVSFAPFVNYTHP